MSTDLAMLAPPLQPIETHAVTDAEVVHWLNEHLAGYAREVLALRQELAERDRRIEMYRRLAAGAGRQEGATQ